MPNQGILGGLPPGLRGWLAADEINQRNAQSNLGMLGGVLSLQNQMEMQPIQRQMAQLQLQQAQNPAPTKVDAGNEFLLLDRGGNIVGRIPKGVTPDAAARQEGEDRRHGTPSGSTLAGLEQKDRHFNTISPYQQANLGLGAARLFNQGVETQWNTGQGVTTPLNFLSPPSALGPQPQRQPGVMGSPPGGWQIPPAVQSQRDAEAARLRAAEGNGGAGMVPTPTVVPGSTAGMTPKAAQEVRTDAAKKTAEMEAKRNYNMSGLNATIDAAEQILKKGNPTASGIGAGLDYVATAVGYAPKGAGAADQLRAISGALTAKMPRMEGPQSDKDVQLYREMAGQVGDATLPTSRRLAALQTVKELWGKYESGQTATGGASGSWDGVDRRGGNKDNDPLGLR